MKVKLNILFVEDVSFDFELMKFQIRKSGIEFTEKLVDTKEAYKEALRSFKPDIILSDYSLPQFNGMQALEIKKEIAPFIPFILVTGALNEETAVQVMKAGSDDYILKQNLTRLGSAIESAINKWKILEEKKQAEESLKKSEFLLNRTNEMAKIGGWEIDLQTMKTFLTRQSYFIFEVDPSSAPPTIQSWINFYSPEARPIKKAAMEAALKNGTPFELELPFITAKGRHIWVHTQAGPIVEDGKIVKLAGTIQDVTERRLAEEEIRKLSQAVEQSPASIVITDLKGNIEYVNPKFSEVTGYSADEAIGKNPRILKSDKKPSHEYKAMWETITSGNIWRGEFHNRKKNGDLYWEFASISSIKNKEGKVKHYIAVKEDITERKHAEEQLRESEAKYRKLIETTSEGFWLINEEHETIDVNQSLCDMLGYFKDEIIGKTPFSFAEGVNKEIFRKQLLESRKTRHRNYEVNLMKKSGDSFPAIFNATSLIDDSGEHLGSFAFVTDISERKKAEELLKSSEERLKILFESAPDTYYLTDLKGTFIDGNKAAEELLGFSKAEMIGKSFLKLDILSPNDILRAAEHLNQSALGRGTGPEEFVLNHKDGRKISVEIRTYPVQIKKRTVVLGIAHDITDRKESEKKLRKSEQKHRKLIETTSEGFWLFNDENNVIDVNNALCEMFNLPKSKIIGRSPFDFIDEADHRIVKKEIIDSKMMKHRNFQVLMKRKEGDMFPTIFNATTLLDDAGNYAGFFAFITDITELRQKEESIKKSEHQLRELTVNMDEKFEGERKRIGKEIHDGIGQLLTGLKMDLHWIEKKWPEESILAKEKFNSMKAKIDVGVKEVQDLSIQLRPQMLDELGLFETIRSEVKRFDEHTGIFCELDFKPENFEVDLRRSSTIYRILMELLTNVYRYSKADMVNIHLEKKKDRYLFVFRDNGIGITQDQINDKSSFGLITINERVNRWNGTFKIAGKPNKGTAVHITIPF